MKRITRDTTMKAADVYKLPCLILEWTYQGIDKKQTALNKRMSKQYAKQHGIPELPHESVHVWRCEYYMNLPLDGIDIRLENIPEQRKDFESGGEGHRYRAMLGGCHRRGGRQDILEHNGDISIPYRDGAHILWDAEKLNLPMYVVAGDHVWELIPMKEREHVPATA